MTPRPIAVITGIGRANSIAHAIAEVLAADGWDLALATWSEYDRSTELGWSTEDLPDLIERLHDLGARTMVVDANLAAVETPDLIFERVNAVLGSARALVLSHSQSVESSVLDTSVESFDRHFAVNARAAWLMIRAYVNQAGTTGGRIVALTSDHVAYNMPYGASKGALDRIVLAAARECAHLGISANLINPGPVDTGWMDDETREELRGRQPTGRLGTPQDTARLIRFLVSDEARWVTGQLVKSDGGFSS